MGWDEGLVQESYEWVEKKNAVKPHQLSPWSLAIRYGLLEARVLPYNGYNLYHLDGTKMSTSTFDNNGKRHTATNLLKFFNPHNIVVLLNDTVNRVLFNSLVEVNSFKHMTLFLCFIFLLHITNVSQHSSIIFFT